MKMHIKKTSLVLLANAALSGYAYADLADVANQFSPDMKLERATALAVLATYNDLIEIGCADYASTANNEGNSAECTGATFKAFQNVRQLAQTANEISGDDTSYQYSMGLTLKELGNALRATAAEEYTAQGSLSSEFVKGQLSGLSARLTSLRLGATGFSAANNAVANPYAAYDASQLSGGGASADSNSENYSRLGGFINVAYGDGKKSATNLEDAFSVDGSRINAGLDYRLDQNWVVGTMIGVSNQSLDFTKTQSAPAGKIETDGYNVMPFILFQGEQFYSSISLGRQFVDFDSERVVSYPPSGDPDNPNPDTKTKSNTNALIFTLAAEFGYSFAINQFTLEPFASVHSSSTRIHSFVEKDVNNTGFDLAVAGQEFKSRLYTVGANLRYTFTPSFGVITPFASVEQVHEANTDQHIVAAHYVSAANTTNVFQFAGDTPDDSYRVFTVGVSSVLLGAHQKTSNGVVAGGLQGFVHYKVVKALQDYKMDTIELGVRYEF